MNPLHEQLIQIGTRILSLHAVSGLGALRAQL